MRKAVIYKASERVFRVHRSGFSGFDGGSSRVCLSAVFFECCLLVLSVVHGFLFLPVVHRILVEGVERFYVG